jgi:CRISPR-associated protein Csy2
MSINAASNNVHALVLLPKLKVFNANLISSPITWGFPAPSAFAGFGYALQLLLQKQNLDVRITGVGIVCHDFEAQVSDTFVKALKLTRNPLDKTGTVAGIVEEGRSHLTVSLLLAVEGALPMTEDALRQSSVKLNYQNSAGIHVNKQVNFPAHLLELAGGMRLAGGSIRLSGKNAMSWLPNAHEDQVALARSIAKRMLPGRLLVARHALLESHLADLQVSDPQASALDALLDLQAIHYSPEATGSVNKKGEPQAKWTRSRRAPGWLVPVPLGYGAISPLYEAGQVKNARDPNVPFRFVESLIGLGEWVHPFRVAEVAQMLWQHHADSEAGLYLLNNTYRPADAAHITN